MDLQSKITRKDVLKMSNIESNLFTKECIHTALLQLLTETSFEKITVTAIIERAGVSRAGFYRNYSSKEKVLEELSTMLYQELSAFIMDGLYHANPRQWFINLFTEVRKNSDFFHLLLSANVPHQFIMAFDDFLAAFYTPTSSKERYYFIAVCASLKEIIIDWFKNGMKETPEEMSELMLEIFTLN